MGELTPHTEILEKRDFILYSLLLAETPKNGKMEQKIPLLEILRFIPTIQTDSDLVHI